MVEQSLHSYTSEGNYNNQNNHNSDLSHSSFSNVLWPKSSDKFNHLTSSIHNYTSEMTEANMNSLLRTTESQHPFPALYEPDQNSSAAKEEALQTLDSLNIKT